MTTESTQQLKIERMEALLKELQAQHQLGSFTQLCKAYGAQYSVSEAQPRLLIKDPAMRESILSTPPTDEEQHAGWMLTKKPSYGFAQNIAHTKCGLGG